MLLLLLQAILLFWYLALPGFRPTLERKPGSKQCREAVAALPPMPPLREDCFASTTPDCRQYRRQQDEEVRERLRLLPLGCSPIGGGEELNGSGAGVGFSGRPLLAVLTAVPFIGAALFLLAGGRGQG